MVCRVCWIVTLRLPCSVVFLTLLQVYTVKRIVINRGSTATISDELLCCNNLGSGFKVDAGQFNFRDIKLLIMEDLLASIILLQKQQQE